MAHRPKFALAGPKRRPGNSALAGPFEPRSNPRQGSLGTASVLNARGNPLKLDPTRTTLLRQGFIDAIGRRMRRIKAAIRQFLDESDMLGLKPQTSFKILAAAGNYQFLTDARKLSLFSEWLQRLLNDNLISLTTDMPLGSIATGPWTTYYVESAYRRGMLNAYLAAKKEAGELEVLQEEFMRTAFATSEALNKVALLATRAFEGLKGITASMAADLNRILAQALIDGTSVGKVAKQMTDQIDTLTRTRALVLARTEIVHAHAEGQLDAFERLGVKELGIMAEWATVGDDKVCPQCEPLEGKTYPIAQARGLIPLHPNCRCSWIPSVSHTTK